jgi:hypothetical protein
MVAGSGANMRADIKIEKRMLRSQQKRIHAAHQRIATGLRENHLSQSA